MGVRNNVELRIASSPYRLGLNKIMSVEGFKAGVAQERAPMHREIVVVGAWPYRQY